MTEKEIEALAQSLGPDETIIRSVELKPFGSAVRAQKIINKYYQMAPWRSDYTDGRKLYRLDTETREVSVVQETSDLDSLKAGVGALSLEDRQALYNFMHNALNCRIYKE